MTLSLDLESSGIQNRGLSLDLERGRGCGTMTLGAFSGVDLIDPSLPLEKQAYVLLVYKSIFFYKYIYNSVFNF